MSKRNIIRVRDRVKIINPEIVIRCGYPLTKQIVKDTIITKEQKDAVCSMLKMFKECNITPSKTLDVFDIFPQRKDFEDILLDVDGETYDKILDILSLKIMRERNFGGDERSLFLQKKESLRNKLGYVSQRKVVKTGKYHHGGGYQDYNGDWDYEPAYLENEQSHVLVKVSLDYSDDICEKIMEEGGVWMERKNLEKV